MPSESKPLKKQLRITTWGVKGTTRYPLQPTQRKKPTAPKIRAILLFLETQLTGIESRGVDHTDRLIAEMVWTSVVYLSEYADGKSTAEDTVKRIVRMLYD